MTELGEKALVQILAAFAAIASLVGGRITWDDQELDIVDPALTLRTLTAPPASRSLAGRGGSRRCLVEVAAHDVSSGGASQLCDLVVDAMTPHESGPTEVVVDGVPVRFGGIVLNDILQGSSVRTNRYRKAALFSVWLYE